MLKDKIKFVVKAIDATNIKVSEYAGMSAPNIGKLTNGSRVPARKSVTVYKLANGIYGYSEANGKTDILCETIGCDPAAGEKKIRKALLDWMYEDVIELDKHTEGFTKRLNDLISIAGVTIPEVCAVTGTSHALLAAYCDGTKIPTHRSKFFDSVCECIYTRTKENNDLGSIAELLEIKESELSDENAVLLIKDWILGRNENAENKAAESIVKQMTAPVRLPQGLPEFGKVALPEILHDNQNIYIGVSGLQRAVIRFLGNAAQNPGSELLLYSDQSMEWMQARFTPKWQTLMKECLQNGVRMKIIHNVDRDPTEILFALQSWLPLYMTGMIEPYYRCDMSGNRFCHTVFISAEGCIDGFCTVGAERDCVYHYSTDADYICNVRCSYEKLLFDIKPLLTFARGGFVPQKQYRVYDCGDLRVYSSYKEVVVLKLAEPLCTFTLKHPYLTKIFAEYARQNGQILTD